jgi:hypothetical protein
VKKIHEILLEEFGTLYITVKDVSPKKKSLIKFVFFFCGWRIRGSNGEIITAIFNDPEKDDEIFTKLSGKKIKSLKYDKYDCRIQTIDNEVIESFALHNDISNKGFYIEECI